MEMLSRLLRLVRSLAGRGPVDRELDLELAAHVDLLIGEKLAAGLRPEEARRQAILELGGIEAVKEEVRAIRPAAWLDDLARDARHGLRLLGRTPAPSLASILVIALGVSANVAVFDLVDRLLLQPLPGAERPGRPVGIYSHDPQTPDSYRAHTYADYAAVREESSVFDSVMAHRSRRVILSNGDGARRVEAGLVTADYFSTLGVQPALGRGFTRDEERPGSGAAVAVLSDAAWRALGGGREALGRTIRLDSRPFTIVGVAPRGFSGPMVAVGPMLWLPLGAEDQLGGEAARPSTSALAARRDLLLVGRLKDGVSLASADAALRGLSRAIAAADPASGTRHELSVHPLARSAESTEPQSDSGLLAPLGILAGLAALLLIVASLTVGTMQLARHAARHREIAMRLALGAGRRRIVQQLMTEAALLALAGGALGLLLGAWVLRLVLLSLAPLLEQALDVAAAPDGRVVLATLAFSLASAALFAFAPASKLARRDLLDGLAGSGRVTSGEAGGLAPRGLLVAGQLALSLALLTVTGLFVRAAVAGGRADPGYRLEGQLLARVDASAFPEAQGRQSLHALVDRLAALPGVRSASAASLVAFANESAGRAVRAADDQGGTRGGAAQEFAIGAGYFRTLGVPLLRGRDFADAEQAAEHPRVAIVDEPLAAMLFPGRDALGRHLVFAVGEGQVGEPLEIVGVVPGLRHRLTDRGPVPHVYRPLTARLVRANVHVRLARGTADEERRMKRELRQAIERTDPRLSVLDVSTLAEIRDASPTSWLVRTAGRTLGALGALALAMAVTGLYGVQSFLVTRRRREMGLRVALGATPHAIVSMVLREGAALTLAGLAAGLLLSLATTRLASRILVGVRPFDPLVFALSTSVLALAALTASYVPARTAARIDPAVTLREE